MLPSYYAMYSACEEFKIDVQCKAVISGFSGADHADPLAKLRRPWYKPVKWTPAPKQIPESALLFGNAVVADVLARFNYL